MSRRIGSARAWAIASTALFVTSSLRFVNVNRWNSAPLARTDHRARDRTRREDLDGGLPSANFASRLTRTRVVIHDLRDRKSAAKHLAAVHGGGVGQRRVSRLRSQRVSQLIEKQRDPILELHLGGAPGNPVGDARRSRDGSRCRSRSACTVTLRRSYPPWYQRSSRNGSSGKAPSRARSSVQRRRRSN